MSYTKKFTIFSYDTLPGGTVKTSSLLKYMQEVAREDSDSSGNEYYLLKNKGMVFILTKIQLEFYKNIKYGDEISIRAACIGTKGASFIRDFVISCRGEKVAAASTSWVLIDFVKRTPLRPTALPITEKYFPEEACGIERNRRINIDTNLSVSAEREIYNSLLDENLHLNNTYYADFVIDASKADFTKNAVSYFEIDYIGECRLGDTLIISEAFSDGAEYFEGYNKTKETTSFRCILKTRKIDETN